MCTRQTAVRKQMSVLGAKFPEVPTHLLPHYHTVLPVHVAGVDLVLSGFLDLVLGIRCGVRG